MLAFLIFTTLFTYWIYQFYLKRKSLPPGPLPLPFIGNLPQLAWGIYCYGGVVPLIHSWRKQYGDILTWWVGPIPAVLICDYRTSIDVMVKKGANFADRLRIPVMNIVRADRGVIISNGQHWTEQRRFALHTLRNFGLGKNLMQDKIMMEYNYRSNLLNKQIEEAHGSLNFDPSHFIEMTVGNIINRMLFSQGFTEEMGTRFFALKQEMDKAFDTTSILDFFLQDETVWLPVFKQRLARYTVPTENVLNFIRHQINTRKEEIAKGNHELRDGGEDFVDAFLIHMEKKGVGDSFDDDTLAVTLLDLWTAGQETTSTTLYWAICYLIQHPETLKKLQKELDEVTGKGRPVNLSDKTNTPYLNATILEVLRLSSLLPLNLFRTTSEETVVGDYIVPKGTAITSQLSLIMSNPDQFPEPEKFKPERFLEAGLEDYVVPFGMGKRACLGESLARAELYLILSNLVLSYNFSADEKHPAQMKAQQEIGSMRKANHYNVFISKRM